MKKITLFLCLISFSLSYATIVVKDISDFTFTSNSSLDFDFNSDGIVEFTFEEMFGTVGAFFNSNQVNFIGYGSIASGYGWDVMKSLTTGSTIGSTSSFYCEGDAYINPDWANTTDMFPAGDSYIGTKFKIGTNTYYGWILVNSTGGPSGTIKVKSYAYNDIPNSNITAGQTLGVDNFDKNINITLFPNPTPDFVTIETNKEISSLVVYNLKGEIMEVNISNERIDVSQLSTGIYFLNFTSSENKKITLKLIKQ